MLFHPPYPLDLAPGDLFYFLTLKIEIKGSRFEAVSSILQTVARELKAIQKKSFLVNSVRYMSDANIVLKRVAAILTDGIDKYS
jgi:hypothetical protein